MIHSAIGKGISVSVLAMGSLFLVESAATVVAQTPTAAATGTLTERLVYKIAEYGMMACVLAFVLISNERRLQRQENFSMEREKRMANRIDILEAALIKTQEESVESVKEFRVLMLRISDAYQKPH